MISTDNAARGDSVTHKKEKSAQTSKRANDDDIFSSFKKKHDDEQTPPMTLMEYFESCRNNPLNYASPAERLIQGIIDRGTPEIIDTAQRNDDMRRVFQSRKIKTYPAFGDFYGIENTVIAVNDFLRAAAAGSEQKKQILLLMGPVGTAKSSLAHRLEEIMETQPVFALKEKGEDGEISPVLDNPLALLTLEQEMQKKAMQKWDIPAYVFKDLKLSSWAHKRLDEAGGDFNAAFEVVKTYPSKPHKRGIGYLQAKDDQTQDVSELIGRPDMNKMGEGLPENDPDVYLYSGGFPNANRGLLHLSEAIKMSDVIFNPVLDAVQDRETATPCGNLPVDSVIIATTNQSEWDKFRKNPVNEALMDRIVLAKVPYTLRYSEEEKIYDKALSHSKDSQHPVAPKTLEILAKFAVMTRLSDHESLSKWDLDIRAQVLNGEIPDKPSGQLPSIGDLYKADIEHELEQGMHGFSTRSAFKTLSDTFNIHANDDEFSADPITLIDVLTSNIEKDDKLTHETKKKYKVIISSYIVPKYRDFIAQEIEGAYVGVNDHVCQTMFDRYIAMADAWCAREDFKDDSHVMSRDELDAKLEEFEAPAGIGNAAEFRQDVTSYINRMAARRAREEAGPVKWNEYAKMGNAIRKRFSSLAEGMSEVIRLDTPVVDEKDEKKRSDFLAAMEEKGYTPEMTRRAVAYHQRLNR